MYAYNYEIMLCDVNEYSDEIIPLYFKFGIIIGSHRKYKFMCVCNDRTKRTWIKLSATRMTGLP